MWELGWCFCLCPSVGSFLLLPCEPSTRNSQLSTRESCSQQPSPGAGSCHLSVGARGRMDAVRERTTAAGLGWWSRRSPRGTHRPQPGCTQNGSSHLKTGDGDAPATTSSPAALGTTATPRGRGSGRDHPIRYRVSSALPRVTWGLWGWLRSHTELPMEPQQCQDSIGGIAPVSQSGAGHCAGVTATAAQGGQCQGYSLGLTATPAGGSHCAGVSTPPVQGDSARSLPHRHGGSTEQRPLRHHTCAGGQ